MVYQRCMLNLPNAEVARNLNVDPSTVCRTVKLFEDNGTVCNIQGYHESPFKKLTAHDELAIADVVLDKPSIHLKEFSNTCCKPLVLMCALQHSTIFFWQSAGSTSNKLTLKAQQRSDELGQPSKCRKVFECT